MFAYLDEFDPEPQVVASLKDNYRHGGLGDSIVKKRLVDVLEALIAPIRARRAALLLEPEYVRGVLREGTRRARAITQEVTDDVRRAFALSPID